LIFYNKKNETNRKRTFFILGGVRMSQYNLSFFEAVEKCLKGEGFIRGNDFAPGCYVANRDGMLVVLQRTESGWNELIGVFGITHSAVFSQKYKLFSVASPRELEMV
jgi:hypothetical protein